MDSLKQSRVIDVLLISPSLFSSDKKLAGDHSYTHIILEEPPDGVRYHHHELLISKGQGNRIRHIQILVHQLRKRRLIAPGFWFESFETDFVPDLIHIISFVSVVRIHGARHHIPIIIGTSTGSTSDLRYYHNWPDHRVRRARIIQRVLLRLIGGYETSLNPQDARRILVWSEFSRQLHLEEGIAPPDLIEVLPPGIIRHNNQHSQLATSHHSLRFLFIGKDFERKNGPLVLQAFRQTRYEHPKAELILVAPPIDGQMMSEPGITHYPLMPREQLLQEIFPTAAVLLLPSRAEGFGLVILEAMAQGLTVIGVNAYAMPEIIEHGRNGFLIRPDSLEDLTKQMKLLAANPDILQQCRFESERTFNKKYTVQTHNERLLSIYEQTLAGT